MLLLCEQSGRAFHQADLRELHYGVSYQLLFETSVQNHAVLLQQTILVHVSSAVLRCWTNQRSVSPNSKHHCT